MLREKINKLGETAGHLLKTFFVYGLIAVSLIVIKVLIARFYGQENLGIFTYFFSIVSFLFLFASFGFPEAITQTIVNDKGKLKQLIKTSIFYMTIFSLLTAIIWFGVEKDANVKFMGLAVILYILGYNLYYLSYSIFRGYKEFALGAIYSLIQRIIFILLIITLFFWDKDFYWVLISFSISTLLVLILAYPRIKTLYQKFPQIEKTEFQKSNLQQFKKLAFCLFLVQVGFYSLRFLSEIIIGQMVDFESLGLYSAHSSITNIIRLIAYVFPVVVLPMATISKFKLKRSLSKILMLLLPFSVLILMITYLAVPILYGDNYKNITLPLILVISSSLLVIYSYLNSVFVGENIISRFYLKIILLDLLLSLALNTWLNIYMIDKWGIIGAPIATTIVIIIKIALNIYGIKKLRLRKFITNNQCERDVEINQNGFN